MSSGLENGIVICNSSTIKHIERHIHLLTLYLRELSFLTEAYILDYFVDELWTKLPSCWLEVIKEFDTTDLVNFLNLNENVRCKKPWPLSLLALRASAITLAIPRKSVNSSKVVEKFLSENFILQNEKLHFDQSSVDNTWGCADEEFDKKSGQHKSIPEFCRRHVKPKKQHEIFRLAKVTDTVLNHFELKHLIDIGSGLGHLSRFLSLSYNFHVATIEANPCHVSGALTFDKQAICSWKRLKKHETDVKNLETMPHHIKESVTLTSSEACLKKLIDQVWCQEDCEKPMNFALLGLHTCGNLAGTLLKTFAKCDELQVLISVGCCYMKMDPGLDNVSYPLSCFVKSLPNHQLSYEAKEMACHAIEMYIKRLQENAPSLKIHCYRATLEKCLTSLYPECKHLGLRGVKHAELLEFSEYADKALNKVSITIPKESYSSPDVQLCLSRWKEIVIFYSIRLIVAPVVESLILLDRLLYLFEQGHPSCLAAIFDPALSPRNHVLLSAKCNNKN